MSPELNWEADKRQAREGDPNEIVGMAGGGCETASIT
jgi:hypothetical protein